MGYLVYLKRKHIPYSLIRLPLFTVPLLSAFMFCFQVLLANQLVYTEVQKYILDQHLTSHKQPQASPNPTLCWNNDIRKAPF